MSRLFNRKAKLQVSIYCLLLVGAARNTIAMAPEGYSQPRQTQMNQREMGMKVALLYRFAEAVRWPSDSFPRPDSPFLICSLGDDSWDRELKVLVGRLVGQHPIEIRQFESVRYSEYCPVLFIGSSEELLKGQLLQALRSTPILTVGETEDFVESGGIFEFVSGLNRIRYEINLCAARTAGLRLGRDLIRLAHKAVQCSDDSGP